MQPDTRLLHQPLLVRNFNRADLQWLQTAWQESVFARYLSDDKPEVIQNMRAWPHSGFSLNQSAYLLAVDGRSSRCEGGAHQAKRGLHA